MKKTILIIVLILAAAIPLTVFAAASDSPAAQAVRGFCGIDQSKLSEDQKADLTDSFKKMMETRKDAVSTLVKNGSLTEEQGKAMISRIDQMIEYCEENGFSCGTGMGRGACGMGASGGCGFQTR